MGPIWKRTGNVKNEGGGGFGVGVKGREPAVTMWEGEDLQFVYES